MRQCVRVEFFRIELLIYNMGLGAMCGVFFIRHISSAETEEEVGRSKCKHLDLLKGNKVLGTNTWFPTC